VAPAGAQTSLRISSGDRMPHPCAFTYDYAIRYRAREQAHTSHPTPSRPAPTSVALAPRDKTPSRRRELLGSAPWRRRRTKRGERRKRAGEEEGKVIRARARSALRQSIDRFFLFLFDDHSFDFLLCVRQAMDAADDKAAGALAS